MTSDDLESPVFNSREQEIIKTIQSSKVWQLIRDSLTLERERLNRSMPDPDALGADRRLWLRQGGLDWINRLLHQGPYLAVYYDRYVREQEGNVAGSPPTNGIPPPPIPPPGEPPDVRS